MLWLVDKTFFNQPIKSYLKKYDNIRKIAICQRDDCTTDCLLEYLYLKDHYNF